MTGISGPEKITRADIRGELPPIGGTTIIVQRHEDFQRDVSHAQAGSLLPEAASRSAVQTNTLFSHLLENLDPNQRNTLDVMVIASPTQYADRGRRAIETASIILGGVRETFQNYGVSPLQIRNELPRLKKNGEPIESKRIVQPKIFDESPGFVAWLKENYSGGEINQKFWIAFEEDAGEVKKKRLEMRAEGPVEMADRLANFIYALKLFSADYHKGTPGRRLVLLAVSHYDLISPYVKTRIGGGKDGYLGVDYGGGIEISIDPDGQTSTKIGEITYPLNLVKA